MSVFSSLTNEIVDFGTSKNYGKRSAITKLTIHHMAAVNADPVAVAKGHRDSSRQASANYYIGSDGKIVGGVSEEYGAWTSSNKTNDLQAITFEVANCKGAPNQEISDAAYKAVIALCADICTRYGFTPHFTGDKNGSLTLHCMFAATACPGPYLKGLHQNGTVERDILAAMGKTPAPAPTPTPTPTPATTDEEKIWNYLMSKINNAYGVAGLMGNLYAESGLRSNNLQNTYEKTLGMTDEKYTAMVDNGSYTNFVHDSAGYGLAQQTFWSRKQNLYSYCKKCGTSIGNLDMQLEFLAEIELPGYKTVYATLQTATSVRQASDIVLTQYECPANQSEAVKQQRAKYGQVYYDKYAGTTPQPTPAPSPCPYTVKVLVDELNIRSGPGTNYPIVGSIKDHGVYTIVKEQNGWGYLKSGMG